MRKLLLPIGLFILVGCGGGEHMQLPASSNVESVPTKTDNTKVENALTYNTAIKPLMQKKCSTCHGQGSAFGNWMEYNQVFLKKDRILNRVVQKKDMPLGGTMTDGERKTFEKWLQEGALEGDPVATEPTPIEQPPEEVPSPAPAEPPVAELPPQTPVNPPAAENPPQAPVNPPVPPPVSNPPAVVAVTFVKDIKPLFERACSLCHNAGSGDFMPNWQEYSVSLAKKANIMDRVVIKKDMPMGTEFTQADRELVKKWIDQGALFDVQPSEVGEN